MICCSMLMLVSNSAPMFLATLDGLINSSARDTATDLSGGNRWWWAFKTSSSVLSLFIFSLLTVIHASISRIHASIVDDACSTSSLTSDLKFKYSWVSSAYRWQLNLCMSPSGLVYKVNNIGPKMLPWDMPHRRARSDDCHRLHLRSVDNQRYIWPEPFQRMPNNAKSLWQSVQ